MLFFGLSIEVANDEGMNGVRGQKLRTADRSGRWVRARALVLLHCVVADT